MASLASTSACVPEFDEDQSLVDQARILAVRSEPAENDRGQLVKLEAFVAVPHGATAFEPHWAFCNEPKPLTELGPVTQSCIERFGTEATILTFLGVGESLEATLPQDACRVFGPIPADAVSGDSAARPVDPDETGGFYQPVLAGSSANDPTPALGRLRLSCGLTGLSPTEGLAYRQAYRPNENPELETLVVVKEGVQSELDDGASFSVEPGSEVSFEVGWRACPREQECGDGVCGPGEERIACPDDCNEPHGCTGAETYATFDKLSREVRLRREGVSVAWYSDTGGFEVAENGVAGSDPESQHLENRWRAPTSGAQARLWLVIRDERGGVGFRSVIARLGEN